ncbi:TerC family protein [Noviherbaspirillum massiliense]|uniref:TerC family protein n=1 Tax=Noviherbaspirillum massiliense TaxID=1465823 RepID=UPI0002E76B50|nr:TerC family protein [Noviherbaspirillum massiliense]
MLELLSDPQVWIAFATLTALELVLGIDNIIFISILVDKLPQHQRELTRRLGLFMAMFMRIGLLLILSWIVGMTEPLFSILGKGFSGRDLVLVAGGLFLLWKSVSEIHETFEGAEGSTGGAVKATLAGAIVQIMLIDLVFSLDSIITAVGMVDEVAVMIAAVIASVGMMMFFAGPIGRFVSAHPTIKMLALSFLVVVAVVLIAEGFGHHVPKGYIYSAMAFSVVVEMLNIRLRKRSTHPVPVHSVYAPDHESLKH